MKPGTTVRPGRTIALALAGADGRVRRRSCPPGTGAVRQDALRPSAPSAFDQELAAAFPGRVADRAEFTSALRSKTNSPLIITRRTDAPGRTARREEHVSASRPRATDRRGRRRPDFRGRERHAASASFSDIPLRTAAPRGSWSPRRIVRRIRAAHARLASAAAPSSDPVASSPGAIRRPHPGVRAHTRR
jgi:hypothetical protein